MFGQSYYMGLEFQMHEHWALQTGVFGKSEFILMWLLASSF